MDYLFYQHILPAISDPFVESMPLREALWQLFRKGQKCRPQLQITPEQLVVFLARQLPPVVRSPEQLTTLQAGDLHLVCAFGIGNQVAQEILATGTMYVTQPATGGGGRDGAGHLSEVRCRSSGVRRSHIAFHGNHGRDIRRR